MVIVKRARRLARRLLHPEPRAIPVRWVRRQDDAWLAGYLRQDTVRPARHPLSARIERIADRTNELGPQPLWEGYAAGDPANPRGTTRNADDVRTRPAMGDLYAELVRQRRPEFVVEFGTAFGVSGMYFLAGLEAAGAGTLLTFDPNREWAAIAEDNLARISRRFVLTVGTFEDHIDGLLPPGKRIDMAFIDAIHTSDFVLPQLEIVVARSRPGTLILLDDISFSADMARCWQAVAGDRRFSASAALGDRVGIVELAG